MTRAARDVVGARLTRDETGANALADANAHTRREVRVSWDEAMVASGRRISGISNFGIDRIIDDTSKNRQLMPPIAPGGGLLFGGKQATLTLCHLAGLAGLQTTH